MLTLDQQLRQICSPQSSPLSNSDIVYTVPIRKDAHLPNRLRIWCTDKNELSFSVPQKIAAALETAFIISGEPTRFKTLYEIAQIMTEDKLFALSYIISIVFLKTHYSIDALGGLAGKMIQCDQVDDALLVTDDIPTFGDGAFRLSAIVATLIQMNDFDGATEVTKKIQTPMHKILASSSIAIAQAKAGNVADALSLEQELKSEVDRLWRDQRVPQQILVELNTVAVSIAKAMAKSGDLEGAVKKLKDTEDYIAIALVLTECNRVSEATALVKQYIQSDRCAAALAAVANKLIEMGKPNEAAAIAVMINNEPDENFSQKEQACGRIVMDLASAHFFEIVEQVLGQIKPGQLDLDWAREMIPVYMIDAGKSQDAHDIALNMPHLEEKVMIATKLIQAKMVDLAIDIITKNSAALSSDPPRQAISYFVEILAKEGMFVDALMYARVFLKDTESTFDLSAALLNITQQMASHKEFEQALEIAEQINPSYGLKAKAFLSIVKEIAKVDPVEATNIAKDMHGGYRLPQKDVIKAFILIALEKAMTQGADQAMDELRSNIIRIFSNDFFNSKFSYLSADLSTILFNQLIKQTMHTASMKIAEKLSHAGRVHETLCFLSKSPTTEADLCKALSTLAIDAAKGEQSQ